MCEANAFLFKNNKEELIMESVDNIEPMGLHLWHLKNIFGEQMKIRGSVKYISLLNHKIVFSED